MITRSLYGKQRRRLDDRRTWHGLEPLQGRLLPSADGLGLDGASTPAIEVDGVEFRPSVRPALFGQQLKKLDKNQDGKTEE